ncbi:MAG: hypothetical protein ABJD53_01855 [Gammaproteobacteria bacterium]
MQFVLYFTICTVMLNDFIVKTLDLPTPLHFLPELLSVVIVLYVVVSGTRDRFRLVAPKYWFAFAVFSVFIISGVINSAPGAGPMLSGMRFYLRAVPLFFLASVLPQSEAQLMRQLKLLLALSLLQIPVAAYQRWIVLSQGRYSGDDVRGTLMDSGILSIFLICVVLVLTGLLLKGRIGRLRFAILFFLMLFPTIINETKGTLVMLPAGLMVALVMGAGPGKRLRYAGFALVGLVAFAAVFIPIYNMMEVHNPYKSEQDITNFFTNEKQLDRYMSSNVAGVGTSKDVRRGDALGVPLQFLSKDPAQLAFGLGLGSVSPSNFGKNFEGSYFMLFKKFLITSVTFFIIEFGLLGLVMVGVLTGLVFMDTLWVSRNDVGLTGAMAAGWTGVVATMVIGLLYTILHEFTSVTYLYWYFSGVICARRMALMRDVARRTSAPQASAAPA